MVKYEREPIDFEKYHDRLSDPGFIWIEKQRLERARAKYLAESAVMETMAKDKMKQKSAGEYPFLTKGAIINYLMSIERCPRHYFELKGRNEASLDMKRCLVPLMENGYAQEFLEYYMEHRSLKSKANNLKSVIDGLNNEQIMDQGYMANQLSFRVVPSANFRFNYADANIISQIPKKDTGCIVAPSEYCLVWGDFAQSDLRIAYNLFMRSPENDKVMSAYDDKYEALARIVSKSLGQEFNLEKFKQDRKLYKRLTLATVYGTRASQVKEEDKFIKTLTQFLLKCPKYVEYYNSLVVYHRLALPIIVKTYFGNEQMTPVFHKESDTVNRGLNCPVQSVTSEVVVMTVDKILQEFYDRGYSEDDVKVYLVRHDEPVFLVREEAMKDSWIFQQYSKIFVDGWSPLALDFEAGYHYGESTEALMNLMAQSAEQNREKISVLHETENGENLYFPVEPVLKLSVSTFFVGEKAVFAVYNENENKVHYGIAGTSNIDDVLLVVRQKLHNVDLKKQYRGIVVLNTNYSGKDCTENGLFIKYETATSAELEDSNVLARYAMCRYCKSSGIQSPVDPPLASYSKFITSVTKFTELD